MFGWLMRRLVHLLRRRRYTRTVARIRALEVGLGYAEPDFVERHFNPDLIGWGGGRRGKRDCGPYTHDGYMAADVTIDEMGPLPRALFEPAVYHAE